jgi:hypothetical protein
VLSGLISLRRRVEQDRASTATATTDPANDGRRTKMPTARQVLSRLRHDTELPFDANDVVVGYEDVSFFWAFRFVCQFAFRPVFFFFFFSDGHQSHLYLSCGCRNVNQ